MSYLLDQTMSQVEIMKCVPVKVLNHSGKDIRFQAIKGKELRRLPFKCYVHSVLTLFQLIQSVFVSKYKSTANTMGILMGWPAFMFLKVANSFLNLSCGNREIFQTYLNNLLFK